MEFVVHVLEKFFAIGHERAVQIMLTVHKGSLLLVFTLMILLRPSNTGYGLL